MFSERSAESAVCCLGVRYKRNQGWSSIGLGGPCYSFKGLLYLLGAVSIFLEIGGEKFQFLNEGILVAELWLCVSGNPGLIVCLQGGDVNPVVGNDWYAWASSRTCNTNLHAGSDM